jgi:glutathione S-transferase
MTSYRLHYFPESGSSYKLALMLTLCRQSFELVWTDFGGGVTRTPEWRTTVNEIGEIPVLEEDGVPLTQTAPILLQLADRYGRFGGKTAQRFEILRWLFWDNHKLTGCMATYRYLRTFTPRPDPQVLAFLRKRIDDYLSILDRHLQRSVFVVDDDPTVTDISLMAYLHYPSEEIGSVFEDSHRAVYAWLGRIGKLPGGRSAYDLLPGRRLVHYA